MQNFARFQNFRLRYCCSRISVPYMFVPVLLPLCVFTDLNGTGTPLLPNARRARRLQFMQRKVKADEVQKQQQDKRDKLERDFSSSYSKRLKADLATEKDR